MITIIIATLFIMIVACIISLVVDSIFLLKHEEYSEGILGLGIALVVIEVLVANIIG